MIPLKESEQKKIIVIALVILLIVGVALWRHQYGDVQYHSSYSSGSAMPAPAMEMAVADEAMNYARTQTSVAMPTAPIDVAHGSVAVDMPQDERLIVKNGSMSMVVEDVTDAIESIKAFAVDARGFVVTTNVEKSGLVPNGYVQVRIPADVFDTGLEKIRAFGDVKSEHIDGRDVTEEYVDLDAQLGNLRATEEQFLSIMHQATKIEDILAVQRELTNVRSQIERIEARMTYLKESAAYSSLTIYLSTNPEDLPIVDNSDSWKPLATVKDALRGLRDIGIWIADAMIWSMIYIPVWIVLGLLVWLGRRWYRRHQ